MASKNRLGVLRKRARLTQEEVGKVLDISFAAVSRHESADRGLSREVIEQYAALYKVTSAEIFMQPTDERVCEHCGGTGTVCDQPSE